MAIYVFCASAVKAGAMASSTVGVLLAWGEGLGPQPGIRGEKLRQPGIFYILNIC